VSPNEARRILGIDEVSSDFDNLGLYDRPRFAIPGAAKSRRSSSLVAERSSRTQLAFVCYERARPSGFSRSGYGEPLVGRKARGCRNRRRPRLFQESAAPRSGSPGSCNRTSQLNDGRSTGILEGRRRNILSAPKVAHIAAHLQNLFPAASPLLYRALIVQSARWPGWAATWKIKTKCCD